MNKQTAIDIQTHALKAVTELSLLLNAVPNDDDDYQRVKRGVGLSIGRIQTEILDIVYHYHPELDHLKDIKYPLMDEIRNELKLAHGK